MEDRNTKHENDRYITTQENQVFDRAKNRFLKDDEIEPINTYEQLEDVVTIPRSVLQSVAGACEEVIRISDRGHNAWTDAKKALESLQPYLVKP
jgi:hypothetical protein